jgi:GTP-binding protein
MHELANFGADLEQKPMIVVASKIDVANPEKLAKLKKYASRKRLPFYEISAVTGRGIPELQWAMANYVNKVREAELKGEGVDIRLPKEEAPRKLRPAAKKAARKAPRKLAKKTAGRKAATKKKSAMHKPAKKRARH